MTARIQDVDCRGEHTVVRRIPRLCCLQSEAKVRRKLREERNLTQEELAKRAKVTRSHLSPLLEAGHRKNPSLEVLKRLARALGVPVAELLE